MNPLDVGVHLGLSPGAPGGVDSQGKLEHGVPTVLEGVFPQRLDSRQRLKHLSVDKFISLDLYLCKV